MNNFVEQISIKFRDFHLITINFVQTQNWAEEKHSKILVKVWTMTDIKNIKYHLVDQYIDCL